MLTFNKTNNLLFVKQGEIFRDLPDTRLDRIDKLSNEIELNHLDNVYETSGQAIKFDDFIRQIILHYQIKGSEIMFEFAKNNRKRFEARLRTFWRGNKTEKQKRTSDGIAKSYNAGKDIIEYFDNFTTMTSKAGYKAMKETKGKGIRILAPKKKCF